MLVVGATGFIGQRLVRKLVEAGARVWVGVAPDESPERVAALPSQVERLVFDLRDEEAVREGVAEAAPQIVFNLAAVGVTNPEIDPSLALEVNVGGLVHLLEVLKGRSARRVVLVGTCYEYGAREAVEGLDPFNTYAASKVAAWAFGRMYWRAYGLPVVTVRPFQVYGLGQPGRTLIPAAISAALAGQDFPMTPGGQARDFIFVDDVVSGMMAAAEAPGIEGESLDLGTGQAHAIRDVVAHIWEIVGAQGEVLLGALPYRPGEVMHSVADADRTARLTGWQAGTTLEEGLQRTIQNYTEQV
ncbi:MAG: NAD(P)-dependent oxidoreductase [Anaerolineae bacterium]|nr:NAD(P)-dependent oxidoreductase [Anaerolineae bacterium]